ncbi:hypothetical protein BHC46_01275 [Snodgrassella alvi]|uniref:Tox-PL domain-containing protein n=1 Tax=Snodgrassella alvi TaxID=1196083 RepID=A0A2N9XNL5_9NEIS|nr:RHS repeat-associated core domain-containing protein [Snodgrassella alvi]PIT49920.1 hypothetical protein BHC46_01275 [Snodgrassella alvi]
MRVAYGWKPDSDWGTSPLWQASLDNNQTLKNANYNYLITDYLGTPQLAVNSRGQQTWKGIADAFGNTQLDPDNQITLNLRQPGQYYDQESGLYYNLARHYNPQTGRYIEADPLGVMGGLNLYGYANANPLMYADPYGLWSMDKAWGFIYDTTGWVPSHGLVNCLAGYGDYMSFGATEWLRDKTNVGGVDKCSNAYRYCTYIGIAQDLITLPRAIVDLFKAYKWYSAAKGSSVGKNLRSGSQKVAGSVRGVNPGYPTAGRTQNCVNCAIATDATLAGRPASALPSKGPVGLDNLEKAFNSKFKPVNGPHDIVKEMAQAGSGARGIVYGSNGPGTVGHVFNVVNQKGGINFVDGQTGRGAITGGYKSYGFMRTN